MKNNKRKAKTLEREMEPMYYGAPFPPTLFARFQLSHLSLCSLLSPAPFHK